MKSFSFFLQSKKANPRRGEYNVYSTFQSHEHEFDYLKSSISDIKFSNSGHYMISCDYLSVKVWDLHIETKTIETYTIHEYLRSKLCSLYENDCIFDKFECCWNGNDTAIMTGSYNNFFRMFDRQSRQEVTYEASKEIAKPKTILKPRKVT